ncbi:uncharacterized protein LOC130590617 [Beta vulgaris subsp. vulgaris]|uniref:uncharacterized protein LOC130590617 n=1 Tax=Beta vulgaris subsp. vulgaris TaxID=3555 RepID=UPI0025466886|nr:uncharacterized protein LOC130590617 [Beta vulgaris subsp. vulgaris]
MKIADITKTTKRSTIKGKIIRSWSVTDFKKADVVNSMDIVLMDIQGGKIQVSCKKSLMSTFSGNLSHGMSIEITNFGVCENTGLDRPTKHCFMNTLTILLTLNSARPWKLTCMDGI